MQIKRFTMLEAIFPCCGGPVQIEEEMEEKRKGEEEDKWQVQRTNWKKKREKEGNNRKVLRGEGEVKVMEMK